jgi:hypothetical protein
MNTTSYYMKVTALNPISHIGKTASTGAIFNTERVNGKDVPYITGASGKGILRRIGMEVMLSMLGLDPEQAGDVIADKPKGLSQKQLEVLFNGSILTSSGTRSIDVAQGAQLAELIPWFAIVGGCMGNMMMQGRIAVHPMILICEENRTRLKAIEKHIGRRLLAVGQEGEDTAVSILPEEVSTARMHLQRQEFTHNDDFNRLGSGASRFLPPADRHEMITAHALEFYKREEPDYQDKENHVQMRFSVQTMTAGAELFWRIDTFDLTPLMEDAFLTTFGHFLARPFVGGMRRMGMGLVDVEFLGRSRVEPVQASFSTAVSVNKVGDMYRAHLQENREEIVRLLEVLGK